MTIICNVTNSRVIIRNDILTIVGLRKTFDTRIRIFFHENAHSSSQIRTLICLHNENRISTFCTSVDFVL